MQKRPSVVTVAASNKHNFRKEERNAIRLIAGHGVQEDAHCGLYVQHLYDKAKDPARPNLRRSINSSSIRWTCRNQVEIPCRDILAKLASLYVEAERSKTRDAQRKHCRTRPRNIRRHAFVCRIGAPQMAAPGPGPSSSAPQPPMAWATCETFKLELIVMTFDTRHRDKNGEISRKHGNTFIHTLRKTYGPAFASGCADNAKLGDVLNKLDEPSLSHLIRDHEAGKLEQICQRAP
jgi:hypothetical protein